MSSPWLMSKVYKLLDVTGLVAWTDYIPVVTINSPASPGTHNADGARVVEVVTDNSGLTPWIDYIPVYETTGPVTFDQDGAFRIAQAGGGLAGIPIIEDASSSPNMSISNSVNGLITTTIDNANNSFKSELLFDYELGDRPKLYAEGVLTYGGGSTVCFGFPWSLLGGLEDMNGASEAGIFLSSIGITPRITLNISSAGGAGTDTLLGAFTTGDVVGLAVDYENLKAYCHKNGTWATAGGEPGVGPGYTITNTIPNSGREGIIFGVQLSRIANSIQIQGANAQYAPAGYQVMGGS